MKRKTTLSITIALSLILAAGSAFAFPPSPRTIRGGAVYFSGPVTIGTAAKGANQTIRATHGTELVTWTDAGWNEDGATWTFAADTLTHVTGNTTAVTATLTAAIVAGTTYQVTIAGTGGGATATYTLGGVYGTTIAASGTIAIEDYITASTTGSLIITPSSTCTFAATAISVKALTDATGDLTLDGNLRPRSQVLGSPSHTSSTPYPAYSFYGFPTYGIGLTALGSEIGIFNGLSSGPSHVFSSAALKMYSNSASIQMGGNEDGIFRYETTRTLQVGSDATDNSASPQTLTAADSTGAGNAGSDFQIAGGSGGTGGANGAVTILSDMAAGKMQGGLKIVPVEATANIEADTSTTITLAIPAGVRLLGAQLRVDTALTATELWDAAFSGGSLTALGTAQAVAKSTKLNKMFVDEITTDVTNVAITKNGGGSFTAAGTIRALVFYETFKTAANAP